MITIYLNNHHISWNESDNLTQLLMQQGYEGNYFAVALNRQFIPRTQYAATKLVANDAVEIIMPMQGG